MKKILSLMLALVICVGSLFALVGCGGPELYFGKEYRDLDSQMDVLLQLNTKSVDVGVMDKIMAGYYMSQDTKYSSSLMVLDLFEDSSEQYGIAARKGSGLAKKINGALIELTKLGVVDALAATYGIQSELCIDTSITVDELTESEMEDWNFILSQKKFIVGYTLFAPIAYEEVEGSAETLTGFDIELAKLVATYLGLSVEFKLIKWDNKENELATKSIDCIWNGMTITEQRLAEMEISIPYLNNKQVAVIRKEDATKYTTLESMAEAIIAAEAGSAGESCIVKE